jgi:hypothetical protein
MIESNKIRRHESSQQGITITPENQVVWQIMQNAANDNLMPALNWFIRVIFWIIFVGGALGYMFF